MMYAYVANYFSSVDSSINLTNIAFFGRSFNLIPATSVDCPIKDDTVSIRYNHPCRRYHTIVSRIPVSSSMAGSKPRTDRAFDVSQTHEGCISSRTFCMLQATALPETRVYMLPAAPAVRASHFGNEIRRNFFPNAFAILQPTSSHV